MDRNWDTSTAAGLRAILERPRVNVSSACRAVEQFVTVNRDNLREFFEVCFPILLKRLFGYDGTSWLGMKYSKPEDTAAITSVLHPSGAVFQAMRAADVDGVTRFQFPRERLPTRTQMLLGSTAGRAELLRWPQYARSLVPDAAGRPAIHMGVIQYFVAWFAFYVLCGGQADTASYGPQAAGGAQGPAPSGHNHLPESMKRVMTEALQLPLRHHQSASGSRCPTTTDAYLTLLMSFLCDFFPQNAEARTATPAGGMPSAAAQSAASLRSSFAMPVARRVVLRSETLPSQRSLADLFYATLIEFWFADGEEPLPGVGTGSGAAGAEGLSFAADVGLWNPGYEPPSEEALAAVRVLATYVAVEFDATPGSTGAGHATARPRWPRRPAQPAAGPSWLPACAISTALPSTAGAARAAAVLQGPARLGAGASAGPQGFARRLYRFLYRAISGWSSTQSTRSLALTLAAVLWPWNAATLACGGGAAPGAGAGRWGEAGGTHQHLLADLIPTQLRAAVHERGPGAKDATAATTATGQDSSNPGFGEDWERHVLSNLPFYTKLLPLFLEAAVGWTEARPAETAEAVRIVLGPLADSAVLRGVLESAELAEGGHAGRQRHSAVAVGARTSARDAAGAGAGAYLDIAPWLADRLADWNEAAGARFRDAGPVPGLSSEGCTLFFVRDDMALSTAAQAAGYLESIGSQTLPLESAGALSACLSGIFDLQPPAGEAEAGKRRGAGNDADHGGLADDLGSWQVLPQSSWRDLRPKGDPLFFRPNNYEIGWLVHVLVSASVWVNGVLGFGSIDPGQPPETRWLEVVAWLTRRGWRVNLRPAADIRNLGWGPVLAVLAYWLLRALAALVHALVAADSTPV